VKFGDPLTMAIRVASRARTAQRLVIDYVVHHKKANGSLAPKTFKLRTLELGAGESVTIEKAHRFVKISTRKYYAGEHAIELQVGGKVLARKSFHLTGVP
jgi:hypothetical protein